MNRITPLWHREAKDRAIACFAVLALLIAACGSMTPKVESTTDALPLSIATARGVTQSVTAALQTGTITAAQAQDALRVIEHARELAEAANVAIGQGRPLDAISTLRLVQTLL